MNVTDLIEFEEGYRSRPYLCTQGYPTIGIGKKIGKRWANIEDFDFTVSRKIAKAWLDESLSEILNQLSRLDFVGAIDNDRLFILISMVYQLGFSKFLKFKKMIAALETGDYNEAANQALDSLWASQTPARAKRHADVIRTGDLRSVYREIMELTK